MCSESESDATLEDTRAHVIHARMDVPNPACTYHNHEYEGDSEKKKSQNFSLNRMKKKNIFEVPCLVPLGKKVLHTANLVILMLIFCFSSRKLKETLSIQIQSLLPVLRFLHKHFLPQFPSLLRYTKTFHYYELFGNQQIISLFLIK